MPIFSVSLSQFHQFCGWSVLVTAIIVLNRKELYDDVRFSKKNINHVTDITVLKGILSLPTAWGEGLSLRGVLGGCSAWMAMSASLALMADYDQTTGHNRLAVNGDSSIAYPVLFSGWNGHSETWRDFIYVCKERNGYVYPGYRYCNLRKYWLNILFNML